MSLKFTNLFPFCQLFYGQKYFDLTRFKDLERTLITYIKQQYRDCNQKFGKLVLEEAAVPDRTFFNCGLSAIFNKPKFPFHKIDSIVVGLGTCEPCEDVVL